jgi:hypothetical protein
MDAIFSHQKPYAPEFQRFEIITETTWEGRTVNAELLTWANTSDGYTKSGYKVLVQSLDSQGTEYGVPDDGTKVWCTFRYDTDKWEIVGLAGTEGKKKLVTFRLKEALTTADEHKTGEILVQYGPGSAHVLVDPETEEDIVFNFYNTETHTSNVYIFEGDVNDVGLAYWDTGTDFIIIQLECP